MSLNSWREVNTFLRKQCKNAIRLWLSIQPNYTELPPSLPSVEFKGCLQRGCWLITHCWDQLRLLPLDCILPRWMRKIQQFHFRNEKEMCVVLNTIRLPMAAAHTSISIKTSHKENAQSRPSLHRALNVPKVYFRISLIPVDDCKRCVWRSLCAIRYFINIFPVHFKYLNFPFKPRIMDNKRIIIIYIYIYIGYPDKIR